MAIIATTTFMVGAASAASVSGEIKTIDTKSRTIPLGDGKVYQLAPNLKIKGT